MPIRAHSPKKPIRVGFDLDGVLLYNPARIVRPVISLLKKRKLIKRKELQFFSPKTDFEKWFWRLFHKTSIFASPAIREIKKLKEAGIIEPYLITGRFGYLKQDTEEWFRKIGAKDIFEQCFINEGNEQPHLFKERMLRQLRITHFVEDNWDIVQYLSRSKVQKKYQVTWITNFFDRKIAYAHKHTKLQDFLDGLRQKKLLVVSDYYLPHWTGISKSLAAGLDSLSDSWQATVLTTSFTKNLKKQEKIHSVTVKRVDPHFRFSRAFFSFRFFPEFWRQLKHYDAVLINSPFTLILPLSLLTKLFGKKLVIFHQGDLNLPRGIVNTFVQRIFDVSTFLGFVVADRIGSYTDDYLQHSRLTKFFLHKAHSMLLAPVFHDKKTRKKHPAMKSSKFLFGISGRFVEEKGLDILFRAIPLVIQKDPSIHFYFAGEKKMEYEDFFAKHQPLFETVKEHFSMLGLLGTQDLEAFYHSIDALVVPSRAECFGLVQPEAMKYQKPVVISNVPGGRDVVRKTGFGEIFRSGDHIDLARKIVKLKNNAQKYQVRFSKVKSYFEPTKQTQKLQDFLSF